MIQVENLGIIVRGANGEEKDGTLTRDHQGKYTLTVDGKERDFVIVSQEASGIMSLIESSISKLKATTVGALNATAHANLTLVTPDGNELPLAVVKGDYFIEPGCIIIAFNSADIRTGIAGTPVVNTYYNHETMGTIVRVEVRND